MRQGAVRAVLSERLREGNILVIEALSLADHRTKGLAGVLGVLGITGDRRALIVDQPGNHNLRLSSRNLSRVTQVESGRVNIVDLLGHERLLFSRAAIVELDKMLGKGD
jgi:large subunit ribosomal protein L4